MADFHTVVNLVLRLPGEAHDWIMKIDAALKAMADGNGLAEPLDDFDVIDRRICTALYAEHSRSTDCEFKITKFGLWVYSANAHVYLLAFLLQEACKRFNLQKPIAIEFSEFGTQPEIETYGGGAVVITGDEQRWMSTGHWVSNLLADLSKKEVDVLH